MTFTDDWMTFVPFADFTPLGVHGLGTRVSCLRIFGAKVAKAAKGLCVTFTDDWMTFVPFADFTPLGVHGLGTRVSCLRIFGAKVAKAAKADA